MEAVPALIDEMKHNEWLEAQVIQITPDLMSNLKDFSSVVSLLISGSQLLFLERINHYRDAGAQEWMQKLIRVLGII